MSRNIKVATPMSSLAASCTIVEKCLIGQMSIIKV